MSKLLRVAQVAELLGLKECTVRSWIAGRRIAVVRLGRAVRVIDEEVERLIAEGTIPAKRPRSDRQ